jgi:hypothetical protein
MKSETIKIIVLILLMFVIIGEIYEKYFDNHEETPCSKKEMDDEIRKIVTSKKDKIHKKVVKSCKIGMIKGCITGSILGGLDGAISGGMVFGVASPIITIIENNII